MEIVDHLLGSSHTLFQGYETTLTVVFRTLRWLNVNQRLRAHLSSLAYNISLAIAQWSWIVHHIVLPTLSHLISRLNQSICCLHFPPAICDQSHHATIVRQSGWSQIGWLFGGNLIAQEFVESFRTNNTKLPRCVEFRGISRHLRLILKVDLCTGLPTDCGLI